MQPLLHIFAQCSWQPLPQMFSFSAIFLLEKSREKEEMREWIKFLPLQLVFNGWQLRLCPSFKFSSDADAAPCSGHSLPLQQLNGQSRPGLGCQSGRRWRSICPMQHSQRQIEQWFADGVFLLARTVTALPQPAFSRKWRGRRSLSFTFAHCEVFTPSLA